MSAVWLVARRTDGDGSASGQSSSQSECAELMDLPNDMLVGPFLFTPPRPRNLRKRLHAPQQHRRGADEVKGVVVGTGWQMRILCHLRHEELNPLLWTCTRLRNAVRVSDST